MLPNKDKIRYQTSRAIKKGELVRKPCEVCGETKVDAHHPDYHSHLHVMWLCRKHHAEWHKKHGYAEGGSSRRAIFVSEKTHAKLTQLIGKEMAKGSNKGRRISYDEYINRLIEKA